MEINWSLEIIKLFFGLVTPIVVAILGVILLRKVESVKMGIAQHSQFKNKWAEMFFDCCQDFLKSMERQLAVLQMLSTLEDPNDELGTALQKEISNLNVTIVALEVRVRRCVVFAPATGRAVTTASDECISLTRNLLSSLKGNLDDIVNKMNEFNIASRNAHAEMLGLTST